MKICVFCASGADIDKKYHELAIDLGQFIAQNQHTLIYGGATGGLMDAVASGASAANGEIIGIIPKIIIDSNRKSTYPTLFIVTENMSERKNQMISNADMFIVLPGGYGTLDEMFHVISLGIVGEHNKPLICLNFNGVYNSLFTAIEILKKENFISQKANYAPIVINNLEECKSLIQKISER